MSATANEIIFKRRNIELKEKLENWTLIFESYVGGVLFQKGNYLIKYPKESTSSFNARKRRAVYFNQVSPIVDMMSGLLYLNRPTRNIHSDFEYIRKDFAKGKTIDEFMRTVSAYSFMFTCGILIDSPNFDRKIIKTEKDRRDNNINPYATLYLPFKIRDFSINNDDGELNWVLLDDSYFSNDNPLAEGVLIIKYTLWTRDTYKIYERKGVRGAITVSEEKSHSVGYVPFKFVSWRDDNNDFVGETICEDIAMISKLIYNNMSYMDEMLASGTFKMLAYPSKDGTVPDALTAGGVGALSVLPYQGDFSTQPSFIGANLSEIDPFLKAIIFYMAEVLKKIGLSTDETKEFVKSGAAKKIDFEKTKTLLVSGAMMMSKTEDWCFKTIAAWEGKKDAKMSSDYTTAFSNEDLETEVTMLTELLVQPVKELRVNVLNILVKKLLTNYIDQDKLDKIYADIEKNIGGGFAVEKTSEKYKSGTKATENQSQDQNIPV